MKDERLGVDREPNRATESSYKGKVAWKATRMVPRSGQTDPSGQPQPDGDVPVVLLVEDEILTRLCTAEQLRRGGMMVVEAANAHEAVAILDSGVRIDLVLTDVRMPGSIDGLGLARIARARWPRLKVAVCSAQDHSGAIDVQTADAFVLKPHDDLTLMRLIRRLLEIERDH
jgi:two-component system, response regulator PdtaR